MVNKYNQIQKNSAENTNWSNIYPPCVHPTQMCGCTEEPDAQSLRKPQNSFSSVLKAITSLARLDYSMDICLIPIKELSICIDKERFHKLCEEGCINYARKWSCPPFAPCFVDFVSTWKNLFLFYLRIDLEQFSYIKNDYLKIRAANNILKSRVDRFLIKMTEKHGNYISTGSCRLCKPCKCRAGMPCAHPTAMTYSFEAMGVNVSRLVSEYFQKPLLWYRPHCLPEYTSVVCGLLTNETIKLSGLYNEYLKYVSE